MTRLVQINKGIVRRVALVEEPRLRVPLKLMTKDIGYAIREGARCGLPLQTAAPAFEVFKHAVGQGLGDQDFSAVVKSVGKN
jgi:3-hydroxyisobutyrate dehydrogenase-like beta-hydroxyacid dehydrogenase